MRRSRPLGPDPFDPVVHVVVTGLVAAGFDNLIPGRVGETLVGLTVVASLLVLSWRRRRALLEPGVETTSPRLLELEDRMADLDQVHQRLLEVEERLDFAERLLAQRRDAVPVEPGGHDRG